MSEADVYEAELYTQEIETIHFGFSPRGFTDHVYNCVLDSWTHVVENTLINDPLLVTAKNKKELHSQLLDFLFTANFGESIRAFMNHTLRHVFRIPASTVLPVHTRVHKLLAKDENLDMRKANRQAKQLESEIINAKKALEAVNAEIHETERGIIEMQELLASLKPSTAD